MIDGIDYKAMGKRVKRLRRMQELIQEQLGELVGCTKSFIGCVENNSSTPSIATIVRIATVLGVTPDYFLLGIDPNEKSTQRIAKKINLCTPEDQETIEILVDALMERHPYHPTES